MVESFLISDIPSDLLCTQVAKFIDFNRSIVSVGHDGFVLDCIPSFQRTLDRVCYTDKEVPKDFVRYPMPLIITHSKSIEQIIVYVGEITPFVMSVVNKWANLQQVGDLLVAYGRFLPEDLVEMKVSIEDRAYSCVTDNRSTIFSGIKVNETRTPIHGRS